VIARGSSYLARASEVRYNWIMETPTGRIVILYHGGCPDGFGGAYAAWKKFGDAVEYIPMHRGRPLPEGLEGAHLYFIDFCFPQETMDDFVKIAGTVTVLDHHEGVAEVIQSMPEYVYETEMSGAGIAWRYFHPETPLPSLLAHVQDDDLFFFKLADTRAVLAYLEVRPFEFELWDELAKQLDDPTSRETLLERTRIYAEYFELLAQSAVEHAKLVSFEGYECYFAISHPLKSMKSLIGHLLAEKKGPIALVVAAHPYGYGVSIRGDGTVDVTKIAQKYGGNGHPNASGFLLSNQAPLPWKIIEDETPRD
jgi:oligoribonuclease NrnB/cAMP/cGMP phosphodiesterase (DHH superfamily)